MHPKTLEALCVDEIVAGTVRYQHSVSNVERLWAAVSQSWGLLWQLGRGLAVHAISLLHSHLSHQSLLHRTPQHPRHLQVHDATPTLVTLLATKARTLSLIPVEPQLSRLSPSLATWVCPENWPLQELVLTGIDMGSELDFLICLLQCCKRLSVLKLGSNCSGAVLAAACDCPLTVLHVSERLAWQPRIQEDCLAKMFIGCDGSLKQQLDAICQGKQPTFKPFWPDLIDVGTGWCKVSSEFLLLLLVTFPRLQQLRSELFDTWFIVKQYTDVARQVQGLHTLSLKTNIVIYSYFSKMYRYFPNTTTLCISNITDVEKLLWEFLEASRHLQHLHELRLVLAVGPVPQQSRFPPREEFIPFGRRITELHINQNHGGDWVFTMLSLFPSVQYLRITGSALDIPEKTDYVPVYLSVTKLECVYSSSAGLLPFLAAVFPGLESLTLESKCSHHTLTLPWEHLCEMVLLRNLRLIGKLVDNISGLCCVPRSSSEGSQWCLHICPHSVDPNDLARLRWCGWTCFYINNYP